MLKKPVTLLMLVLYFVTATGFALNVHYCFNRIKSVQIDAPAKTCTQKQAALAKKHDCCKDKIIKVKVEDEHQGEAQSLLGRIFSFHLPKLPFEDFLFSVQRAIIERFSDNGPPPQTIDNGVPIIIKNSNLRI